MKFKDELGHVVKVLVRCPCCGDDIEANGVISPGGVTFSEQRCGVCGLREQFLLYNWDLGYAVLPTKG